MFQLNPSLLKFPPVQLANNEGLLAYGGDLSIARLIEAYKHGIFPWYDQSDTILWWAPDPRMVLFPDEIKISKSMRAFMRKSSYAITKNKAFKAVISHCATVRRKGQEGTWLHQDMQAAYYKLYQEGRAFSIEVWNAEKVLVGGLYVIQSNQQVWSGESMFHLEPNTSKLAFIYLAQLAQQSDIKLIDCQLYTDHLASLGAREIPRFEFMTYFDK